MIFLEYVGSRACLSATYKDANHICGSHFLFVILNIKYNETVKLYDKYIGSPYILYITGHSHKNESRRDCET